MKRFTRMDAYMFLDGSFACLVCRRDGNPNVTPAVTREVSFTARREAATLYLKDVKDLNMELSATK